MNNEPIRNMPSEPLQGDDISARLIRIAATEATQAAMGLLAPYVMAWHELYAKQSYEGRKLMKDVLAKHQSEKEGK